MEDKKILNNEELEKITGGLNDDLCPNCGAELHCINHTDTGDDTPDWGWELDV